VHHLRTAAVGLLAGRFAAAERLGQPITPPPPTTARVWRPISRSERRSSTGAEPSALHAHTARSPASSSADARP
jgi:hypothetical protein